MNSSGRIVAVASLLVLAAVIGAVVVAGRSDDGAVAAPAADGGLGTLPGAVISAPPGEAIADVTPDLPNRGPHLPMRDIDGWLQSDVTSLEELRGQVVAVQFWTFACRNCKATLPHMQELYANYRDQGFEIVGVHSPEFSFEAEVPNIVEAAEELGVTWPIVLDPTKHTFHDWQEGRRGFWPRIYLLDRDGNIRYDHHGEGRYGEIDAAVRALLAEPAS